jgi:hypothetical protein
VLSVKFKLKVSRRQLTVIAVIVLVVVAVLVSRSARHSTGPAPLDGDASRACTDFADGYPAAATKAQRLALADKVTRSSSQSSNGTISQRATAMGRAAGDTDDRWTASANALLSACHTAGWRN